MSFQPKHGGLYFAEEHLRLARENLQHEPIRGALDYLNKGSGDPLVSAQLAGLRWRLTGDDDGIAAAAAGGLRQADLSLRSAAGWRDALGWLAVADMLRDDAADWLAALESQLAMMPNVDEVEPLDGLWGGAVLMAAGIVLEQRAYFERGRAVYKRAIHQHIHPEGYLKGIVDAADAAQSYERQVSGTCALVLMAEMAWHVGLDLWLLDNRGITPITATAYLLYYYFYPETWKWGAGLTRETTAAVIRAGGAFVEMVNRRHPLPGAEHLFAEQRPMFSICGGLTTLTHGIAPPPKKKRWRLF